MRSHLSARAAGEAPALTPATAILEHKLWAASGCTAQRGVPTAPRRRRCAALTAPMPNVIGWRVEQELA